MIIIQKSTEPSHRYVVNIPTFDDIITEIASIRIQATEQATDIIQATEQATGIIQATEQSHVTEAAVMNALRRGTMNRYEIYAFVHSNNLTSANIEFELPADILNGEYEITISDRQGIKGKTLLRIEERYPSYKQNNIDRIIKE